MTPLDITPQPINPSTSLRELIHLSPATPGQVASALVTIITGRPHKEIARELGVKPSVLSRAINGTGTLGQGIRARLEKLLGVAVFPAHLQGQTPPISLPGRPGGEYRKFPAEAR